MESDADERCEKSGGGCVMCDGVVAMEGDVDCASNEHR